MDAIDEMFAKLKANQTALKAIEGEDVKNSIRLIGECALGDTGQSVHCRAFLWSVWRYEAEPDPISGSTWSPAVLRAMDGALAVAMLQVMGWAASSSYSDDLLRPWVKEMQEAAESPEEEPELPPLPLPMPLPVKSHVQARNQEDEDEVMAIRIREAICTEVSYNRIDLKTAPKKKIEALIKEGMQGARAYLRETGGVRVRP